VLYFAGKNKFKAKFQGTGKFDYSFESRTLEFLENGTIQFDIKGRVYHARRIDESLELTLPDGRKQYCPKFEYKKPEKPLPRIVTN
jgi:hypothetical protein